MILTKSQYSAGAFLRRDQFTASLEFNQKYLSSPSYHYGISRVQRFNGVLSSFPSAENVHSVGFHIGETFGYVQVDHPATRYSSITLI